MFLLVIEIIICVLLGIGLILALILCYSVFSRKSNESEPQKKIEFLSTSASEDFLVQNVLMAYYEQQRNELIERQKMTWDISIVDTTLSKNNESGYTSIPSPSYTPHSLYECSGFASMDNLEVSNPLFSTDIFYDNERMSTTSFPTKT